MRTLQITLLFIVCSCNSLPTTYYIRSISVHCQSRLHNATSACVGLYSNQSNQSSFQNLTFGIITILLAFASLIVAFLHYSRQCRRISRETQPSVE
ncbi:hypothetical protein AOQ84DRAFT_109417 [Glonium stellatum]|uniref:Uncharacterized protein n=1 Tax=Glonium stellatum TaxID=574774 RepID=A0A8E2FA92_9PEZI|nr:hypothetical protein AOQ84DRAFT_109417 [Glonium stellatum]